MKFIIKSVRVRKLDQQQIGFHFQLLCDHFQFEVDLIGMKRHARFLVHRVVQRFAADKQRRRYFAVGKAMMRRGNNHINRVVGNSARIFALKVVHAQQFKHKDARKRGKLFFFIFHALRPVCVYNAFKITANVRVVRMQPRRQKRVFVGRIPLRGHLLDMDTIGARPRKTGFDGIMVHPGAQKQHVALFQLILHLAFGNCPLAFKKINKIVVRQHAVNAALRRGRFIVMRVRRNNPVFGIWVKSNRHRVSSLFYMFNSNLYMYKTDTSE